MKPILFDAPMVKAILTGKKTQTRRPIPWDTVNWYHLDELDGDLTKKVEFEWGSYRPAIEIANYRPGDILYVRETWAQMLCAGCKCDISPNPSDVVCLIDRNGTTIDCDDGMYIYKATDCLPYGYRWRPSIHMPREAARVFLRVTDVRIERLQKISEEDAIAEGVAKLYDDLSAEDYEEWAMRALAYSGAPYEPKDENGYKNYLWHGYFGRHGMGNKQSDAWAHQYSDYDTAVGGFSSLWELIYAKRDRGWNANPWVWVYTFERVDGA